MKFKLLNNEKKPLTTKKLKSFKGFESITEQEAMDIVIIIENLSTLILKRHEKNKGKSNF